MVGILHGGGEKALWYLKADFIPALFAANRTALRGILKGEIQAAPSAFHRPADPFTSGDCWGLWGQKLEERRLAGTPGVQNARPAEAENLMRERARTTRRTWFRNSLKGFAGFARLTELTRSPRCGKFRLASPVVGEPTRCLPDRVAVKHYLEGRQHHKASSLSPGQPSQTLGQII
jgi:hypothetical protein